MKINSYDELVNYLEEDIDTRIILFNKEENSMKEIGYVTGNEVKTELFLDKEFFFQHKNKLKDFFLKMVKKNLNIYEIPTIMITEELVDYIVNSKELDTTFFYFYNLTGENVDDKFRNKLEQSNKYVILNDELISTMAGAIYKKYFEMDSIIRDVFKLTDNDVDMFAIIGNHTKIMLIANFEMDDRFYRGNFLNNESLLMYHYDERKYFEKVLEIFERMRNHGRKYDICILVNDREKLLQSGILDENYFNIFLCDGTIEYTKEEYEREEEYLNELVRPIKEANFTPFEKYLAVYNIVKKFKAYKENYYRPEESRELRYILYNEYMTCYGFSKLLKVLLEKVGIASFVTLSNIDHSYDEGFTSEEKSTDFESHGHARNIVKIDDDKYDIHGIYLADSTVDNDLEYDLYSYVAVTFDKMKESFKLEELKVIDLLMDFHSKDEFMEKFNYLVKKLEKPFDNGESFKKGTIFHLIYLKICEILRDLDYQKYDQVFKKYENEMELLSQELNEGNNQIFNEFLNDYVEYMIPLVNKQIDKKKIIFAGLVVKKSIDKYDEKMLKDWLSFTSKLYSAINDVEFPYVYDPEESRNNYLELKENQGKKR